MVAEASINVYFAAFTCLLGALCFGFTIGYSSPAFVTLSMSNDTKLNNDLIIDDNAKSLIGSSVALGGLIGGLLGGPSAQLLGRKKALVFFGLPSAVGWTMIAIARNIFLIVCGRCLTGIAAGMMCVVVPTYLVEISTPAIRGMLGTFFQLNTSFGIFLMSFFGIFGTKKFNYFFNWRYLALIGVIPSIGISVGMLGMPESPGWLVIKYGKNSYKAEKELSKLRTKRSDIQAELDELQDQANESKSTWFTREQISRPEFWKPAVLALSLMLFQQISGINMVLFFQTEILKNAGYENPAVGATITCLAQVIITGLIAFLMDKIGRKKLLIASGIGEAISLATLGVYFLLRDKNSEQVYTFIPVLCLLVFIVSFAIGFGPIPWLMMPEITVMATRGFISSIATAFNWFMAFIVSYYFETLKQKLGEGECFLLYAFFSIVSIIFVIVFVPETKNKTFEEIQVYFLPKKARDQIILSPSPNSDAIIPKSDSPDNLKANADAIISKSESPDNLTTTTKADANNPKSDSPDNLTTTKADANNPKPDTPDILITNDKAIKN